MNPRIESVYKENIHVLNSLAGLELQTAIEEQYFFEGKLDGESRGILKLKFSNDAEYTFGCDTDAQSLNIKKGGFANKGTLETDYEDGRYKWTPKEFINSETLQRFGQIQSIEIQLSNWYKTESQTGCRIKFKSGDFLYIWTVESDNIFYRINYEPNYSEKVKDKLRMKNINGV